MDIFFKIRKTASKDIFIQLFFLLLLLIFNSLLEVVGVGMIIPIYKIIVSFETFSSQYLANYEILFFLLHLIVIVSGVYDWILIAFAPESLAHFIDSSALSKEPL